MVGRFFQRKGDVARQALHARMHLQPNDLMAVKMAFSCCRWD